MCNGNRGASGGARPQQSYGTPSYPGMRSAVAPTSTYANTSLPGVGTTMSASPYGTGGGDPYTKMPPVTPGDSYAPAPAPGPWAPPPGQVVGGSATQQGTWQPTKMPPIVTPTGDTGASAAVTPSAPGGYSDAGGGLLGAGPSAASPYRPMGGMGRPKDPRMNHSTPTPTFEQRDPAAWARMQQVQAHNSAWDAWLKGQGIADPGVGNGGALLQRFYAENPQWAPKSGPGNFGGGQAGA